MRVLRILVIFVFMMTCRALEELDSGRLKHVNNKILYYDHVNDGKTNTYNKPINRNYVQDTKQNRNERSHPNKMIHETKMSPKARPINLRLDTVPRKLNFVPTVIKPIIKVPVPMLERTVPINKKEHFNPDNTNRTAPKINVDSKVSPIKVNHNPIDSEKPAVVKHFFEDDDEPIESLPKERPKLKECKSPEIEIKVGKKDKTIQTQFTENDEDDDDNVDNRNEAKPEPTPHIDEKQNCNVKQNSTNEIKIKEQRHKNTEPVDSTDGSGKPEESRNENHTDIEEITLVGVVFTKNETENENKTTVKVKLEGQPGNTGRIKIEPNDTSLIISNHGYEEFRERCTMYAADAPNTGAQDSYNAIPNTNYPYYPYEKCNPIDPNNYRFDYDHKTPYEYNEVYSPRGMTNYQVFDVLPDNTNRMYRSWKNTEVRINKGNKPINVDIENCYRDRSGMKMPFFCDYRPAMSYGCYCNQNMACPYYIYPGYR